jgi:hypothetical protein
MTDLVDARTVGTGARDASPHPLTVGHWLASLQPAPPAALMERLRLALASHVAEPVEQVPESCLAAGEHLLDSLLASGATSRGSALDLLTVDALVTYAFESAADMPELLEARAARAMSRIASLPGDRPD